MTEITEEPQPWARQTGERDRQFQLFTLYRDFGPARSIEKVVQKCKESEEIKEVSLSYVTKLSAKFGWVDRASEWDDYLDGVARSEQELAVKEMVKRQAENAQTIQNNLMKLLDDDKLKTEKPTSKAWFYDKFTAAFERMAHLEHFNRGEPEPDNTKSGLKELAKVFDTCLPEDEEGPEESE